MPDPRDGFEMEQNVPPAPRPAHNRRADIRFQAKNGTRFQVRFDVRGESTRDVLDEVIAELVRLRALWSGESAGGEQP